MPLLMVVISKKWRDCKKEIEMKAEETEDG
jgi:hypothetical protein